MKNKRTMLPEWAPLKTVQLTWPHDGTDWRDMLPEVEACYLNLAKAIAERVQLLIVTPHVEATKALITSHLPQELLDNIVYFACDTNDTWARDHAFITVSNEDLKLCLMDYCFDGWGGKFEASLDNAINKKLHDADIVKGNYENSLDFTLEGGSIESDGLGTLLTTSQCLLNPNRNPDYTKDSIEARLKKELGADRILWLDYGFLTGDDTDSHVDTLARFASPDTIVYIDAGNPEDEQYEELKKMEEQLQAFRKANGTPYKLFKVPLPRPVYNDNERLPATYANFLILNNSVLVPTYNQPDFDEQAIKTIQEAFPTYEIVGIDCCALIKQHGSLHCATMQYPNEMD